MALETVSLDALVVAPLVVVDVVPTVLEDAPEVKAAEVDSVVAAMAAGSEAGTAIWAN